MYPLILSYHKVKEIKSQRAWAKGHRNMHYTLLKHSHKDLQNWHRIRSLKSQLWVEVRWKGKVLILNPGDILKFTKCCHLLQAPKICQAASLVVLITNADWYSKGHSIKFFNSFKFFRYFNNSIIYFFFFISYYKQKEPSKSRDLEIFTFLSPEWLLWHWKESWFPLTSS